MEDLKQLIHKRGQLKARLTRFKTFFNTFSEQQEILQLKLRLSKFESCWKDFEDVQSLIEYQDQSQAQAGERDDFENSYFDLMSEVESYISHRTSQTSPAQADLTTITQINSHVKLPTLSLPNFDGSYDQWLSFYDTFQSLIHSNPSLTEIQKFHYLRSTLIKDAALVIQSLQISAENYEIAWSLLKQRYENKRWIIQNHIKALFELPLITRESHVGLRQLLDNTLKHLRALKTLKQPVEFWDSLIIHLLTTKFDQVTKKEWETTVTGRDHSSMDDIIKFLTHRCQLLEVMESTHPCSKPQSGQVNQSFKGSHKKGVQHVASHVTSVKVNCPICQQGHPIFQCKEFNRLTVEQRIKQVRSLNLCYNCLKGNHYTEQCESGSCKKCSKKHNTLLHLAQPGPSLTAGIDQQADSKIQITTTAHQTFNSCVTSRPYIILSTAVVKILDSSGRVHHCRALLDSGSQSNFITKSLCKSLGLKTEVNSVPVVGISQAIVRVTHTVQASIRSRFNAFQANLTCLVLPKITEDLPLTKFDAQLLRIPNSIKLADPDFNVPSEISLLIGAELFYDLLCVGQIKSSRNSPVLQKTQLGWVVSGGVHLKLEKTLSFTTLCNLSLDAQLARFWSVEECGVASRYTDEEQTCEDHFKHNFRRDEHGRCIVKLPFKADVGVLGQSKEGALKRFYAVEKKLGRQPLLQQQYVDFMDDYLNLGHMEKVSHEESTSTSYFLPHHAVMKETSSTTKLRVVFDGSFKTTTGISLNDILMVGPTIQQDLYSLVTRFRTHRFALTADITKMYRQINIDSSQTSLQQILWRPNPEEPIATYRLTTVTYGTSSAPFLATRCLQQVALDGKIKFPTASCVALRDFYVDDLLTGFNSIADAKVLCDQLIALLASGGFELRKWASNTPDLLADFPVTTTTSSMLHIQNDETTKTLGLSWNSKSDSFQFTVQVQNPERGTTKRSILSTIARIFDPLGLIGPVILKAKMMMQRLWQLKLGWDESVPIRMHTEWTLFQQQLAVLNTLAIPRRVVGGDDWSQIQLHGFCDASEAAYGACLYIRSTDTQGKHFVNLLCSKSKVAPLKVLSLPRLELCGAVLLAQLAQRTLDTLDLKVDQCFFWTDSTIVLAWLSSSASKWKTFVANRVSEIQRLTDTGNWHHVNTEDNPADHVSRGLSPTLMLNTQNWWKGPSWLSENAHCWPSIEIQEVVEAPEKRTISMVSIGMPRDFDLFNRFSSLTKLQHVVAYCLRFVANALVQPTQRSLGPLSVPELGSTLRCLLKLTQHQEFKREIEDLANKRELHCKSHLASLHPFIDTNGLLRVGGRLLDAPVAYDHKHPILLPANHQLTKLIVTYEHVRQLHAGPQALLAAVRARYWPLSARNLVRQIVHNCVRCAKARPVTIEPLMGDLPQSRVSPTRPFFNCGVDFCGPFYLRLLRRRGGTMIKTYIALFVCFATKAVHLSGCFEALHCSAWQVQTYIL